MDVRGKIRRRWVWLAVGYALVAFVPPLLMDTEHGAAFSWAAAYLLIPIVALAAWSSHRVFGVKRDRPRSLINMLLLATFTGVLFLATAPLVLTLNAILPPQSHLLVEGRVVQKRVMRHLGTQHLLKLDTPDGLVDLDVTPAEFHRIRERQIFQQERRIGPTGITYRWIWERKE